MIPAVEAHPNPEALQACGVTLAVLFGSHAKGTARPGSDVDIGLRIDGPIPGPMDEFNTRLLDALGAHGDVDLVFLDLADPLLLYEVALTGRSIYESAIGTFEEFRIRAIKLYYDTDWIRRREREALQERLG